MPILLRQEKQALFRSPDCPASQPWGGLEPSWGQEGQGSNRGRGEGTWARVVPGKWPQGEPPPADTPRREGCKKKKTKKLLLPFCLPSPSARPMAPPDCLRVGCAPSKWLPSSSAEPRGAWDAGHWGLGRAGGGRRSFRLWFVCGLCSGRGAGSQSQADGGSWLRVMEGRMGQRKPNQGELREGLGKGRSENLVISSPQEGGAKAWWRPLQDAPPFTGRKGSSWRGAGIFRCISRGGHKRARVARGKEEEALRPVEARGGQSPKIQPSAAPVLGGG